MEIAFQKDRIGQNKNKYLEKIKKYFKNTDNNFYYFLILCLMGFVFFIDSLLKNQFTTLFGGDYMAQQLSFYTNGYDDWWTFIKTGKFVFFDTNTYFGASNIGSNSFYYLFDPFFLPILLFPRAYIAQGMVFVTVFKIALSGIIFLKYMGIMGASRKASKITAFAYAFNGWMAWFLWFNHMTEVCIIFPIMLIGVEKVLREKKPWTLMVGVALMGITNYFFLIGMTIAAFFYAIFRYFQRLKKFSAKENLIILGIGFVGFLTGLLISAFVSLPSILTAVEAPRSANSEFVALFQQALADKDFGLLFNICFNWNSYDFGGVKSGFRHAFPIINFCFPCASCRGTPLTVFGNESYDNTATNIYCYAPMMLMFVPAFIKAMKEKKWSVLVATILFLLALEIPFTYFLFFGFTSPYGRWELFFVTSFLTFSGLHIDHMDEDPFWAKLVGYVLIIVLIIVAGVVAQHLIDNYSDFRQRSPYISAAGATIVMCLYVSAVFAVTVLIKNKESRCSWMSLFLMFEATAMGYLTIEGHWCGSFIDANNGLDYNNALYNINQKIANDDKSYYRCWSYLQNEDARNDGMRNDYNGLGCFHSLYNFNLNNFLNWTRIQDGGTFDAWGCWSGSYVWKNSDLDKFLGVKYYFIQKNSPQWGWMGEKNEDSYQYNVPLGFEDVTEEYQNGYFEVFKDTRNINFAFGVDNVISYETKENSIESQTTEFNMWVPRTVLKNNELMLEGALLDKKTADEVTSNYSDLHLSTVSEARKNDNKSVLPSYKIGLYDLSKADDGRKYTVNTFFEDYATAYLKGAHALTSEQLINVDNGFFEKVDFPESENEDYGRYVSVVTPPSGTYFSSMYDENGYSLFIPYYYYNDYAADIYLISDKNQIITWDRHQDDKYRSGGERYRGFYVHPVKDDATGKMVAPKLAKIIIANRELRPLQYSFCSVYFEKGTHETERLEKIRKNAVENVKYGTNTFRFTTNYDSNKFVITQIPFEKGWSVTAQQGSGEKKKLDVYSVQGGFVGFVAEKGDTTYLMEFYPEYLKEGKIISVAGMIILLSTFYGYYFYNEEYKKKEKLLSLLSVNN